MPPPDARRSLPTRRRSSTAAAPRKPVTTRRHEYLYAAYSEAARDAAFMADMAATARAFDVTLADGCDWTQ